MDSLPRYAAAVLAPVRSGRVTPKHIGATVVVLAACIVVGPAHSKVGYDPFPSGQVCGKQSCFAVRGATSEALTNWERVAPYALQPAPRSAPFYRIHLVYRYRAFDIKEEVLYVPSRRMIRVYDDRSLTGTRAVGPYWRSIPIRLAPQMNHVVNRVAPYGSRHLWPQPRA